MLRRKAERAMEAWKREDSRRALIVTGARQVGKTYLIDRFASERYANVVRFDLVEQRDVCRAFNTASSADELFMAISAFAGARLVPGETVVFIDEVQEAKEALTLVKYLVQRANFDYILSGSLLGVELGDLRSAPVGYARILEMFPLDFEEFCWASGVGEGAWSALEAAWRERRPLTDVLHERFLSLFHAYLLVGGMPDPVRTFIEHHDVQELQRRQDDIIALYHYDIAKYAARERKLAIRDIFDQVPSQLDSQSKRFNFSALAPRGTYERYREDFAWLVDAGVVIPVRNVAEPTRPLRLRESRSFFKLFMNDVGLLSAACGIDAARSIVSGDLGVNYGAVYENAVAQELHAHGLGGYFFRSRKLGEIDFVVQTGGRVLPIEVKSGKDYKRHSALTNVLSTPSYGIDEAVVLCERNLERDGKVLYCPAYMAAMIGSR